MGWWPWTVVKKSELEHLRNRDAIGQISARQALNAFAEVKELRRQIREWEFRCIPIPTSQLKQGDLLVVELPSSKSFDADDVALLERQIKASLPQVESLILRDGVRLKAVMRAETTAWT